MRKLSCFLVLATCLLGAPRAVQAQEYPLLGFALSPVGAPEDFSQLIPFYAELGGIPNGAVVQNSMWRTDLVQGTDAGQVPPTLPGTMGPAELFGFTPVLSLAWYDSGRIYIRVPGNSDNTWRNLDARMLFKQMLTTFLTDYKPPYLFLGVENSFYYDSDTEDYPAWIEAYNEFYDHAKALSPDTMIGPTFQFEHIAGLSPRLNWNDSHWGALESHDMDRVDIVGLSSYAYLAHYTPEEVPFGYWDPLFDRIGDKPVALLEVGWPGEDIGKPLLDLLTPWEATESAQVRFLDRLEPLMVGRDIRMLNWLFLNQPVNDDPRWPDGIFEKIALRKTDGTPRPVDAEWFARFGDPDTIFLEDFDSGELCRWSSTVAAPACPVE